MGILQSTAWARAARPGTCKPRNQDYEVKLSCFDPEFCLERWRGKDSIMLFPAGDLQDDLFHSVDDELDGDGRELQSWIHGLGAGYWILLQTN